MYDTWSILFANISSDPTSLHHLPVMKPYHTHCRLFPPLGSTDGEWRGILHALYACCSEACLTGLTVNGWIPSLRERTKSWTTTLPCNIQQWVKDHLMDSWILQSLSKIINWRCWYGSSKHVFADDNENSLEISLIALYLHTEIW